MSGPDDPRIPDAAVLLTQVAVAQGLAAACALAKVAVDAVPTDIGAVGSCRDTSPGQPEAVARVVSQVLQNTTVVLLVQRGGRMTGSRWVGGQEEGKLSPALMLDGAPAVVEQLLLGQVTAAELPGVVTSVDMSRWRAVRTLARAVRPGRRGQDAGRRPGGNR